MVLEEAAVTYESLFPSLPPTRSSSSSSSEEKETHEKYVGNLENVIKEKQNDLLTTTKQTKQTQRATISEEQKQEQK